jgi:hypothetical protein
MTLALSLVHSSLGSSRSETSRVYPRTYGKGTTRGSRCDPPFFWTQRTVSRSASGTQRIDHCLRILLRGGTAINQRLDNPQRRRTSEESLEQESFSTTETQLGRTDSRQEGIIEARYAERLWLAKRVSSRHQDRDGSFANVEIIDVDFARK